MHACVREREDARRFLRTRSTCMARQRLPRKIAWKRVIACALLIARSDADAAREEEEDDAT